MIGDMLLLAWVIFIAMASLLGRAQASLFRGLATRRPSPRQARCDWDGVYSASDSSPVLEFPGKVSAAWSFGSFRFQDILFATKQEFHSLQWSHHRALCASQARSISTGLGK